MNVNQNKTHVDNEWITKFLTEKSHLSKNDESIKEITETIISSQTLNNLVKERHLDGKRFCGWTTNGSKGYTDVTTGNIYIKKTGTGSEPITLAYECINSKNRNIYKNIGIKYAFEANTEENRKKFAEEILGVEAKALYVKCKLVSELNKRDLVKDYYLKIFDNEALTESEKILMLQGEMKDKGVVHGGEKKAFEFYSGERYDDIVGYYKNEIKLGHIG